MTHYFRIGPFMISTEVCKKYFGKRESCTSQPFASVVTQLWNCRFLYAFGLFYVCCLIAAQVKLGLLPANEFSFRSWTVCAIQDFDTAPVHHPNVAFLGSSLLYEPFNAVDAEYLQTKIDCSVHHTSTFFKRQLDAATGLNTAVFSFALPGEMPSDAYLLSKYFLGGNRKPDLLIVAVGPRDFIDASIKGPMSTDPFEKLSRFGCLDKERPYLADGWEAHFVWQLKKLFYLYGHQQELLLNVQRSAGRLLDSYLIPKNVRRISLALRRELIPSYHFWEIGVNDSVVLPPTKQTAHRYVDNSAEYRFRYGSFPATTFNQQTHFFGELLLLARERGIPVIVIAMPQTDIACKMIRGPVWSKYESTTKAIASSCGATFIDWHHNSAFVATDFADVVHLNSRGGKKLLTMLAREPAVVGAITTNSRESRWDLNLKSTSQGF